MKRSLVFTIFLLVLLVYKTSFAFLDEKTHPILTDKSIEKSVLKTEKYLSKNLGDEFSAETESVVNGKKIIKWLEEGSVAEDSPNCRAASHFLNPLKDWAVAGVSDTNETILGFIFVNPGCFVLAPFSDRFSIHKYADVTWATGLTAPGSEVTETGNDMDWNAARNYYGLALTETDKNRREGNFAKTFQTLGQVMHLLQDMAVLTHVRNDFSAQRLREGLS